MTAADESGQDPVDDALGQHGMFMLGINMLFLTHMPMFTMKEHMYQVILRASLPHEVAALYRTLRLQNPTRPYNLINVESDLFTLPQLKTREVGSFKVTMYDGYSNNDGGSPGPVLFNSDKEPISLIVDEVVYFRPFDFACPYPELLTYILYGFGREAHLSHYISHDPDFQHELTLPSAPSWLTATQLQAGVQVNFIDLEQSEIPCSSPLIEPSYKARFQGQPDTELALQIGSEATIWFSTGNLLNAKDPCSSQDG
ncbi:MAG TPA: hypothetical protein VID24_04470 [Candidatus Eremiobacteraceae bacterium]|jgi:hypothetical protein